MSASNPLAGMLMGAMSGQAQTGQDNPAQAFAQQSSQLQQANPQMITDQLTKVKELLSVLFVQTATALPNVSDKISKVIVALSGAIKEAQQGQNVQQVLPGQQQQGGTPPVGFSLASQGQQGSPMSAGGM
jgi:hypothetical protein